MSMDNHEQKRNNYSKSKHQNGYLENDFSVCLTKRKFSAPNIDDDDQVQHDDEEKFTDLQSCSIPIDPDSDTSRSSSPMIVQNERLKLISHSSRLKQNHGDDIRQKTTSQQFATSSCQFEPYFLKSFDDISHLIHKDPYNFIFTAVPKENNNYIQCRFICDKCGLFPIFHLEVELENNEKPVCLLTAEKETKIIGSSHYAISLDLKFSTIFYTAELVCNTATGTSYTLYVLNRDQRQELAVISYDSNFLGLKGPRKFEVILRKFDHEMHALPKENDINEYCSDEQNDSFIHLHNKTPIWNQESHSYVLRFHGKDRVPIPSVKNFQMIIDNKKDVDQVVMQFGQMSENMFSCDFRYPLSFVQAFGIGLSAFETCLFRQ